MNSRASIADLINSLIRDNTTGSISAADLRVVVRALADSSFSLASDKAEFSNLSDAVIAAFTGGLDPAKYKGWWNPVTNTPAIPDAAPGNAGWWYVAIAPGVSTGEILATEPITIASDPLTVGGHAITLNGSFLIGDRILSDGTQWTKLPAPPVMLPDGIVSFAKLSPALKDLWREQFSPDYVYALVDGAGAVAFGIRPDGSLFGKMPALPGSIDRTMIEPDVRAMLPQDENQGSEYAFVILDSTNRVGFGIRLDGSIVGKFVPADGSIGTAGLRDGAVTAAKLDRAVRRYTVPNVWQLATTGDDGLWRAGEAEIVAMTSQSGSGFSRFPRFRTSHLVIANDTGTPIEVRRCDGLNQRGAHFGGDWSPVAGGVVGTNLRSWFTASDSWPPFGSGSAGDYAVADTTSGAPRTAGGLTFKRGDLLVWTGSVWVVQASPPSGTPDPGEFWNVTASGQFDDVTFTAGDRIIFLGMRSSGGVKIPQWCKQRTGEWFFRGEFVPGSFSPSSILDGDYYIASAYGTFSGISFDAGDACIRRGGVWGVIREEVSQTLASGALASFRASDASEFEVRRADKSTTRVYVTAKGPQLSAPKRAGDGVLVIGDSMVAVGGFDAALTERMLPRPVTALSYYGAASFEVLAMLRKAIRSGDPYRSLLHCFSCGINDGADSAQTKSAAVEMASLAGNLGGFLFLTVIGQRAMTFNGTRLVCSQHENAFANGGRSNLDEWYEATFPGRSFNQREALRLLSLSNTTKDPQFPGLTEGQVASIYGVLPFSFWFDYGAVPWTPGGITFAGYRSAAGLPTGGTDGDYWLRTGNGTVGNLIVRWGGTWTEYSYDATHMQVGANTILAGAFADFLETSNL